MRKILLVIDEFNELVGLETLFRRLGFDVLSLGRETTVAETVLGFPPDLVIATAKGRNVNGLKLTPKIRHGTTKPKLALLVKANDKIVDEEMKKAEVDALIETPFEPRIALKAVARLLQLSPDPLLEKYTKIVSARLFADDSFTIVKSEESAGAPSFQEEFFPDNREASAAAPEQAKPAELTEREKRYQKFLEEEAAAELPPLASADAMKDARKKLTADTVSETVKLERLAREKREFLRAMMDTEAPDALAEAEVKPKKE